MKVCMKKVMSTNQIWLKLDHLYEKKKVTFFNFCQIENHGRKLQFLSHSISRILRFLSLVGNLILENLNLTFKMVTINLKR